MGLGKTLKMYKQLGRKEFMERWKKGIEGISALNQTQHQLASMRIILLGIFLGLIVTFFSIRQLWWVTIILVGALYNTCVGYLGLWQKKRILQMMQGGQDEFTGQGGVR